jgi:hypothetical protein
MLEIGSSGSVGERGGNDPLYPEKKQIPVLSYGGLVSPFYNLKVDSKTF